VTAPTDELVDQIRHHISNAIQAGEQPPGRPTLGKLTGASDWKIRQALAALEAEIPPALQDIEVKPSSPLQDSTSDHQHDHDEPVTPVVAASVLEDVETDVEEPSSMENSFSIQTDSVLPARSRLPRPWPLAFIALAAAVAVWGGWVRLGELTGFGPINVLPGIGNGLVIDTAVVLPLSVEFYGAYALRVLLASGGLSEKTKNFARWSFITSLVVGGAAQIASHVMGAASVTTAPWWVTTLVACVPVLVVGLATGLATLVRQDAIAGGEGGDRRA
jgi:hypothetical protein